MEALIRWQHPEYGTVLPADFISILEEISLISSVGEWVIQTACKQLRRWHDAGYSDLSISINLSSRQCNNSSIVDIVRQAIHSNHLDPGLVELEITESLLMRNVSSVDETLESLSKLGVRVAIDDFGTGYSSLSYLKRFPIDILKIDRTFTSDIVFDGNNSDDIEIVKAIIALGKTLKLKTIAEGVENQEQSEFLTEIGCDSIQGYLVSKPLSVQHINIWLSEQYACLA
jgi:EAL domain-containing protein (putative c-di-GMP-specific phosphodiesterase class I)